MNDVHNWTWAMAKNSQVPWIASRTSTSLVSYLPATVKTRMKEIVSFAEKQCTKRQSNGKTPPEWTHLCEIHSPLSHQYTPRWTAPVFYFRGDFARLFDRKTGLDVGARINNMASVLQKGFNGIGQKNALLIDTLVPHFKYYSNLGSFMNAIDLNAPEPDYVEIERGDARCLAFPSESFAFITSPMLLGHGNPCSTYLEIAFCLGEFKRVLEPGGFIYIADPGFQPAVSFAAQCLDFEMFPSKGSDDGLPLGTLLRKPGPLDSPDVFESIFAKLKTSKVIFTEANDEAVWNCNLTRDTNKVFITRAYAAPDNAERA